MKLEEESLNLETRLHVTVDTEIFQVKLQIRQLWQNICPALQNLSKFCLYVLDNQHLVSKRRKLGSTSKLIEILNGDRILYVWLDPPTVAQEFHSYYLY